MQGVVTAIITGATFVGTKVIAWFDAIGSYSVFLLQTMTASLATRLKIKKLFAQMEHVGINSMGISLITGTFAGAVLALQSYKGFQQIGGEDFLGPIVALSMTRELGPVLTGLMVTGRAGSSIAAEIGTMRITEQIDALQTLQINTFQYLIVPRILAGILIVPLLALFAMVLGIFGGYAVSVYRLGLNGEIFKLGIKEILEFSDVTGGMIKAAVFGFILTSIGCYKGYYTTGGAGGVGRATTQTVVISSILIIIANYFLASILFGP